MKNIISFIIASASLVFGLTSCSKDNLGMEDIFNGNDKTVVAPLDFQAELGNEALEILNQCAASIMNKNHKYNDVVEVKYAVVINSYDQLEGVTDIDGNPVDCTKIDIDFDKYSIIESCLYLNGPEYVADRRVRADSKKIKLYIELKNRTIGHANLSYQFDFCLFEKLPDAPVEVSMWNSDFSGK